MLRFSSLLLAIFSSTLLLFGQHAEEPVSWTFSLGQDSGVYAVLAKAQVADGWYIYGQFIEDGGPIPTALDLSATPGIELRSKPTEEGDAITGFDRMFEMDVTKYADQAVFIQAFGLPETTSVVEGTLTFMTCMQTKCLPPKTIDISLPIER